MPEKKVIIFCDTNILFGLFVRLITGEEISHSALFEIAQYHDMYISVTIINELETILARDHNLFLTSRHIETFFVLSNFLLREETISSISPEMISLVFDIKDLPVLYDAVALQADYLLTRNIKDFDIEGISRTYGIEVIPRLGEELVSRA